MQLFQGFLWTFLTFAIACCILLNVCKTLFYVMIVPNTRYRGHITSSRVQNIYHPRHTTKLEGEVSLMVDILSSKNLQKIDRGVEYGRDEILAME